MRHVLSVLVENEPGVLSRISGLFSGRGFNIETLNVGPTQDAGVSMMTITTSGDDQIIEQIIKQLRKLVTVIKVVDLTEFSSIEVEMMLIKIHTEDSKKAEIYRMLDVFRCKIVDVGMDDIVVEATGDNEKLRALLTLLQRYGIKEMARTGSVALKRSLQLD